MAWWSRQAQDAVRANKYFELKLVGLLPQLEILAPFGRSSVTHNR